MKITEATPEQKIEALIELGGNVNSLISYDVILPLIQKQPVSIQMALDLHMRIEGVAFWTVATPTQLADALLVATGKFEA
jgi:hypothetical protein